MVRKLFLSLLSVTGILAYQQPQLSADEIMKRVAANQDREQKERLNFLYEEKVRVTTRRTNGKLAREEWTNSTVVPTAKGIEKKRQSIQGRYWHKRNYVDSKANQCPKRRAWMEDWRPGSEMILQTINRKTVSAETCIRLRRRSRRTINLS